MDTTQDEYAYLRGQYRTQHGACICPELAAWVSERLQKDNELTKQRRKAQELAGLASPAAGGKKK